MGRFDLALLHDIGLTDGEIKVYLALLEYGASTTGTIAKHADVHTSKVYPILDRLIQKGLASYILQGSIRRYNALPAAQLLEYIRNKRRGLETQEEEIRKLIPQIELRQKLSGTQQTAAVYEGADGVKALFTQMLDEWQPSEEYLVFSPGDEFQGEELNRFFLKHHLERIDRGITVKILALESQRAYYRKKYAAVKGFTFRYTELSLPAGINVVHNKVSTLIWRPLPTAFVIDSPYVAKEYRAFFHRLWDAARP